MSASDDQDDRLKRSATHGAAQFGAAAAVNAARASDWVDPGWAQVERMLKGEANKLNSTDPRLQAQARGNVFESLNDLKDNIARAQGGKLGTWENTRLNGQNRAPQDSVLVVDGKVYFRQDKLLNTPSDQNLKSIAHEKYAGMEITVPEGEVAQWQAKMLELAEKTTDPQEKARYQDAAKRIRAGVSRQDVTDAVEDGKAYHRNAQIKAFAKEAVTAAGSAALGASVVTGTISSIRNGIKLYRGDITRNEAIVGVVEDTAFSAVRAGAVGALSVGIRTAAQKSGVNALKKGGPAGAIAAASIEVGRAVYDLAKGNISAAQAMESLGETGCATIAGLYVGSAAATAFGNMGVIPLAVGGLSAPLSIPVILASTTACITVSLMYQTCLQIFKTAELEREEAERVMALAMAAEAELRAIRDEFEQAAEQHFLDRREHFQGSFDVLEHGMQNADVATTILGLAKLAETVGGGLRFADFEVFEEFMEDPDAVLVL